MSNDNLKATIISARKDDVAKVDCPHCQQKVLVEIEDLESKYEVECPYCANDFDIDFIDFQNNFHSVLKMKHP